VAAISPNSGNTSGGTPVTVTGTGFMAGATVNFGGATAASINIVSSTLITATTPPHAAGAVNVVVSNPDGQSGTLTNGYGYTTSGTIPQFGHVFLVVEENQSYSSVIGSALMPYLNSLASRYGLATSYYANTHPSIGNYFWLTTGQNITNDSNFSGTVTADNIVRQLLAAGKTWKSYAESLPSVGYSGGDQYPYVKRHNPFAYFSDVLDSQAQANNLVPFSQFAADLANNQLPNYSFIIPNQYNNAHDCPQEIPSCTNADKLTAADNWLSANIAPLLASPVFQQDGLLVVTFDESDNSDTANGGGHIATLVIGPRSKPGYFSNTFFQHQSTLRMISEALGLTNFPGASATAPNMLEFFDTATTPVPVVNAILPNSGTTAGGTSVTITGSGFTAGPTVMIGGLPASIVTFVDSNSITAITPTHAAGTVNITVTNTNGQSGTLANGYTYTSPTSFSLAASPSTAIPGQTLTVTWTAPSGRPANDWIGLFKVGDPETSYISWRYTGGASSGNATFTVPNQAGQFEFRYFTNDSYNKVATSNTVTVSEGGATYSLAATPSTANPGQTLTLTWTAPSGRPGNDWIGLFKVGDPETSYISWQYTGGASSGSATFTAPSQTGEYEFRYFTNDTYNKVATSNIVTVSGAAAYSLAASPSTANPGQTLTVTWTAPSGRPGNDWIGLFKVGTSDTSYISWRYTGGASSGSATFTAPSQTGQYEFRYFLNDGYTKAVQSNVVTVN
jgi:acid phosphatase